MLDCIVDLSHWQPPSHCDFHAARSAGILGVIVKVSQGTSGVDPAAREHIAKAREAGMLLGAYHFLTGENGGEQAAHFLDAAAAAFGIGDAAFDGYLLALDWERNTGPGGQGTPAQAGMFVAGVATENAHLVLYGNPARSLGYTELDPRITALDLWLPKYGPEPVPAQYPGWTRDQLKLWQHTDGKQGFEAQPTPGLGRVDRTIWFGDEAGLRKWWGKGSHGAAQTPDIPPRFIERVEKEVEEMLEKAL